MSYQPFNPGDPDLPGELYEGLTPEEEEAEIQALFGGEAKPLVQDELLVLGLIPLDASCPFCLGHMRNPAEHEILGKKVFCLYANGLPTEEERKEYAESSS